MALLWLGMMTTVLLGSNRRVDTSAGLGLARGLGMIKMKTLVEDQNSPKRKERVIRVAPANARAHRHKQSMSVSIDCAVHVRFAIFGVWSVSSGAVATLQLAPGSFPHSKWSPIMGIPDKKDQTIISTDLPSFSGTSETFFVFYPEEQHGMQCRFGERGVAAAQHQDPGRNMIAMLTGAKRYILSPPRECSKFGIFPTRVSPLYRHSSLNFEHLNR
jgi:hypothetical protein